MRSTDPAGSRTREACAGALAVACGLAALLCLPGCMPDRRVPDAGATEADASELDATDVEQDAEAGGIDAGGEADAPDTHVPVGCTVDAQCAGLSPNPCHTASCDAETGYCKIALRPDGSKCGGDTKCGRAPVCSAGVCVYQPKDCSDGNPCTVDGCSLATGCSHTPVADDDKVPCSDDNLCTLNDVCVGGKCVGKKFLPKTHCPGGDDICLIAGCEEKKGCVVLPLGASAICDDGDKCTKDTKCTEEGECVGKAVVCPDDGNPCTIGTCLSGSTDKHGCQPEVPIPGLFCGASDPKYPCKENFSCQLIAPGADPSVGSNWQCKGTPKVCEGPDGPCLTCSIADGGVCKAEAPKEGNACGDGDPCLEPGKCKAGKCSGVVEKSCDDGNLCTTDACKAAVGCVHLPLAATATCDDGNPCTKDDVCAAKAACAGVDACDDGNPCTEDTCGAAGCKSAYLSNGTACAGGGKCWGAQCLVAKCPNGVCDFNESPSTCAGDCPEGGGVCDPKDAAFDKCMGACQAKRCVAEDAACAKSTGCTGMVGCMAKASDDLARLQCLQAAGLAASSAFFDLNTCLKSKCEKNAWWGKICTAGPTQSACVAVCGVHACYRAHITCYGDAACKGLEDCTTKCKSGDQACVKACQSAACKVGCKLGDAACVAGCGTEAVFGQDDTVLDHDALVKCRQIKCY